MKGRCLEVDEVVGIYRFVAGRLQAADFRVVIMLQPVGELGDGNSEEGVDDGENEDDRRH